MKKTNTEYLLVTDVQNDICNNRLYVAEVEPGVNLRSAINLALGALKLTSYADIGDLRVGALKKYGIHDLYDSEVFSVDIGDEVI